MRLHYVAVPGSMKGCDSVMSDIDLGEIIRQRRKELGLSQDDLAHKTGFGLMTYGRIERGEVQPKLSQVRRIFLALGLSLNVIEEAGEEKLNAADYLDRIQQCLEGLRDILGPK